MAARGRTPARTGAGRRRGARAPALALRAAAAAFLALLLPAPGGPSARAQEATPPPFPGLPGAMPPGFVPPRAAPRAVPPRTVPARPPTTALPPIRLPPPPPSDPVPPLVAQLARPDVRITTAFAGETVMVFGATARPISGPDAPLLTAGEADGETDDVLVVVEGPPAPMVVRRKVRMLAFWVNGPAARFGEVPGFYAIAGTRSAAEVLPAAIRQAEGLGLDALPLRQRGAEGAAFRAALLAERQAAGLWQEDRAPVQVEGGRLFSLRLDFPATVDTGDYRVEVLLVRDGRVAARRLLPLRVERTGSAARIAGVAQDEPLLYGALCVLLAAAAGWIGSVVFRRG